MRKIQPTAMAAARAFWQQEAEAWLQGLDLNAEPRTLMPLPVNPSMTQTKANEYSSLCIR